MQAAGVAADSREGSAVDQCAVHGAKAYVPLCSWRLQHPASTFALSVITPNDTPAPQPVAGTALCC